MILSRYVLLVLGILLSTSGLSVDSSEQKGECPQQLVEQFARDLFADELAQGVIDHRRQQRDAERVKVSVTMTPEDREWFRELALDLGLPQHEIVGAALAALFEVVREYPPVISALMTDAKFPQDGGANVEFPQAGDHKVYADYFFNRLLRHSTAPILTNGQGVEFVTVQLPITVLVKLEIISRSRRAFLTRLRQHITEFGVEALGSYGSSVPSGWLRAFIAQQNASELSDIELVSVIIPLSPSILSRARSLIGADGITSIDQLVCAASHYVWELYLLSMPSRS